MPDYIFMLESRLSAEQLRILNRIQQEALDFALNIYLVGGAVRDLMTGSPIRDLDFSVEGNPQRLAKRLASEKGSWTHTNQRLRSTEFRLASQVSFSLEMARNEFHDAPGKLARVSPAPILEDLRRRDFSVNAMGISLAPGSRGLLLDPTNGLADIENRELRVLHNYSFVNDPVRLLRLVRFATRLGFRLEPRTQELFEMALERGYQTSVKGPALGREVEQICREEDAGAVLKALAEKGLLAVLHPRLQRRKPDYAGLAKLQRYRQQAEEAGYRIDSFYLTLHYLLRRLPGGAGKQFLRRLSLDKQQTKKALNLEREARQVVRQLTSRRMGRPRQVFHLLNQVSLGLLVFILAEYSGKKKVQAKVYNFLFKYLPLSQKLPVRELQLMGVQPGPKFDQILEKYFQALLDGRLRNRAQQLRFLRKLAGLPKAKPKAAPKPAAPAAKERKGEAPAPKAKALKESAVAQEEPAAGKAAPQEAKAPAPEPRAKSRPAKAPGKKAKKESSRKKPSKARGRR